MFDKKLLRELYLVVVYGASQDDEKAEFLAKLDEICADIVLPTVIGGDFNILCFLDGKNKSGG